MKIPKIYYPIHDYRISTPTFGNKAEKPNENAETKTAQSFYEGDIQYPENYNAIIKEMMEDENFDEEFEQDEIKADVQKLISDASVFAQKLGRTSILQSTLDDEGLPLKGFDLGAVIQTATNKHYTNSLLQKLINTTKSKQGALFTENFCDEQRTALFGIEEHKGQWSSKFDIKTRLFSPDGLIQCSTGKYDGKFVYSTFNSGKNQTITKYKDDNANAIQRPLDYKISIEYTKNNTPKHARYLVSSSVLPGAYNEFEYDLSNMKSRKNIPTAIMNNSIKPTKTLSRAYTDENGNKIYEQNYETREVQTSRFYKIAPNGSTEINYKIKSGDNILLNTRKKFTKNPDGTCTTEINGKKYQQIYDENARTITVKSDKGERVIDINDKISNAESFYRNILLMPDSDVQEIMDLEVYKTDDTVNTEEDKDILWKQAKLLPADLLFELDENVIFWTLDNSSDSYFVEGLLGTQKDAGIGILAHELGHSVENKKNMKADDEILDTLYDEEIEFIKTHSGEEITSMIYLLNNENDIANEEREYSGGIDEVIAETNCALHAPGIETDNISLRTKFLIENFPKTIGLIAKYFAEYE